MTRASGPARAGAFGLLFAVCGCRLGATEPEGADRRAASELSAIATGSDATAQASAAASATSAASGAAAAQCAEGPPLRCVEGKRLVRCEAGQLREQVCTFGCQILPDGRAPRCAPELSPWPELLALFATTPYVEERCEQVPLPQAPGSEKAAPNAASGNTPTLSAKRCRYSSQGLDAEVVTLSPDKETVARWLIDASGFAKAVDDLREREPARYRESVLLVARAVRNQSSRIFPISGDIVEHLGLTPERFGFDRGVVSPCPKGGCACRINSLRPGAYCRYQASLGTESTDHCAERLAGPRGDLAWRDHCYQNHLASLQAPDNAHFRAAFYDLGKRLEQACPDCSGTQVVAFLSKRRL